jgi:hypothetical protein
VTSSVMVRYRVRVSIRGMIVFRIVLGLEIRLGCS